MHGNAIEIKMNAFIVATPRVIIPYVTQRHKEPYVTQRHKEGKLKTVKKTQIKINF